MKFTNINKNVIVDFFIIFVFHQIANQPFFNLDLKKKKIQVILIFFIKAKNENNLFFENILVVFLCNCIVFFSFVLIIVFLIYFPPFSCTL